MVIHSGLRPYVCMYEGCGQRFTQKSAATKHFKAMHTPEGQARQKKQEQRIAKFLTKNGIDFKREHHISFKCFSAESTSKFARIDFVIQLKGSIIFLEVDVSLGLVCVIRIICLSSVSYIDD